MTCTRWSVVGLLILAIFLAQPANAQLQVLTYRPVEAVYSTGLDRLILVSPGPNQLHVYDPVTKTESVIALPYAPNSVGLSVDGKFAAVGYDGYVSWVDLQSSAIVRTVAFGYDVAKVAVANGFIYAFPRVNQYVKYTPVTGGSILTSTFQTAVAADTTVLVSSDTAVMVVATSSYSQVLRLSVSSTGSLTWTNASLGSTYCSALLLDATRLFSKCGTLFSVNSSLNTLTYRAKLESSVETAAASLTRDELAVVMKEQSNYSSSSTDTELKLYSASTIGLAATIPFPKFVSGAKTAKSKGTYLAYPNDGSRVLAVVQADPTAGFLNDYGIVTFTPSTSCNTILSAAALTVPGMGGRGQVDVTATGGCVWQATSNAAWLSTPRNTRGGDASTLQVFAMPNPTLGTRTATVTVGSQTLTVVQAARSAVQPAEALAYEVVDAAYSKPMDRLLMLSTNPDQLHIYDPAQKLETGVVELGSAPSAISVSPDGLFAAVSLDGRIVRVNLQSGTVVNTFLVSDPAGRVALSATHIYSVSAASYSGYLRATEIATGTQTSRTENSSVAGALLLSLDGNSVFAIGDYALQRWRLTSGLPAAVPTTGTGVSGNSYCSLGWQSQDGLRLFTGCGSVLRLSESPSQDLQFGGRLPSSIMSAVHLPSRGLLFVIPRSDYSNIGAAEIQRYTYQDLVFVTKAPIPSFALAGEQVQSQGKYLFANSAETVLYSVLRGQNSNASVTGFAVYSVPVDGQTACTYTFGSDLVTLPQSGYSRTVAVITQPGCSWTASSNSSWISASGSGIGSGTFNVSGSANTTLASRTGSVGVLTSQLAVTQKSLTDCSYRVPSAIAWVYGSSAIVPVEATPGCSWSVSVPPSSFLTSAYPNTGYASFSNGSEPSSAMTTNATVASAPVQVTVLPRLFCQASLSKTDYGSSGQTGSATLSFTGTCPATWTATWTSSWVQMSPTSGSTSFPQTVQIAAFPNFSTSYRSGWIAFGSLIAAIQVTQSYANATEPSRFVGRAYFAAFGRVPAQTEIDFQIANALNKGVSRAALLKNFLSTAEFNLGGRFIAGLYVGILARDAEYGGWLFQRNALATGKVTQDQLVANFLNSEERRLRFGTVSDTEFVRLLYRYVLSREGSSSEIAGHAATLTGQSRIMLARAFLNTPEFQIGANSRLMAFLLYAMLLARDPLRHEMTAAVARLNAGTPFATLVQEILDGPEFPAQVN